MRKTMFLMFVIIFILSVKLLSASDNNYSEANELYKNGKFSDAISIYNEIIDDGNISSDIYYNLANAYFKDDKLADAILYYERAKKLNAEDEDILFNLKIANLKTVDKINEVPKLFFIEWYDNIYTSLSSNTWSWIIIITSWLMFAFLLGYFIIYSINSRKILFFAALVSFVALLFFNVFAYEQFQNENRKDEAIIFTPSAYVKSSPSKSSTDLFILHEGTKVKILDHDGDWKKIKIADGNIGWILQKSIEII